MMLGTNMRSTACSQDFQVRPIWSWRWTRDNPLVPGFQYFQACTSSRKNNLALKNKNTQESFFMRIKNSWDLKNLGFLCQQNGFGGEKLVGLHTAFIKLLWKHINWQSTCWDLLIYTMISEHQNTPPIEVLCTGYSMYIYIYTKIMFWRFWKPPIPTSLQCAVEKLQKKNLQSPRFVHDLLGFNAASARFARSSFCSWASCCHFSNSCWHCASTSCQRWTSSKNGDFKPFFQQQ